MEGRGAEGTEQTTDGNDWITLLKTTALGAICKNARHTKHDKMQSG